MFFATVGEQVNKTNINLVRFAKYTGFDKFSFEMGKAAVVFS